MVEKQIATFLAPSKGLSILGAHCYAQSGAKGSTTGQVEYLNFVSPGYIVGTLTLNAGVEQATPTVGVTAAWQLSFNGIVIAVYKSDSIAENMPSSIIVPILIPPRTEVKITVLTSDNNADKLNSCSIIGRVYA